MKTIVEVAFVLMVVLHLCFFAAFIWLLFHML